MRRAVWVHQFSQQSEQTPADYAETLLPRGITAIYAKAVDGTDWMNQFYSHPLVPASRSHLAELTEQFAGVGLELIPWVVPRADAEEADMHALIAPRVIIDWEYRYAGFWMGSLAEATTYFQNLRAYVAAGQWIAVAPDPRQPGRDYQRDMIRGLSAYLPQCYWTDFQRDAVGVLQAARGAMGGLDPFEPILPSNSTPSDMQAGLEWCATAGCQAVSLWRMGTANADQLDAFAQKVAGEEPEEPPVPEPPDCAPLINGLAYLADDVGDQFLAEAKRLSMRKTVVRRLVAEMARVRLEMVGPRP